MTAAPEAVRSSSDASPTREREIAETIKRIAASPMSLGRPICWPYQTAELLKVSHNRIQLHVVIEGVIRSIDFQCV